MEATEEIVKAFLETEGYLVKTDNHFILGKNKWTQPDIIAVKLKGKSRYLPQKIVGEVKSWPIGGTHFKEISEKHDINFSGLGNFSKEEWRQKVIEAVEEAYGTGFRWVLFVKAVQPRYEQDIMNLAKQMGIVIFTHAETLKYLRENILKKGHAYFDNAIIQTIRLQNQLEK